MRCSRGLCAKPRTSTQLSFVGVFLTPLSFSFAFINPLLLSQMGTSDDCASLAKPPSSAQAPLPDGAGLAAPLAVVPLPRKPGDDGGKLLALSSFGDALGPYDFSAALFGPSTRAAFPLHGPVRMVAADPINACDVKAFKVRRTTLPLPTDSHTHAHIHNTEFRRVSFNFLLI